MGSHHNTATIRVGWVGRTNLQLQFFCTVDDDIHSIVPLKQTKKIFCGVHILKMLYPPLFFDQTQ